MATKNNIWNGVFIFNNMLLIGFYILSYKKLYWEFFHIYIYILNLLHYITWYEKYDKIFGLCIIEKR